MCDVDAIIQNTALWPVMEGLTRPDWGMIYQCVSDRTPAEELGALCTRLASYWLGRVASELGPRYRVQVDDDFRAITSEPQKDTEALVKHARRSIKATLELLPNVASDEGYGPHVLVMADNQEDYYRYLYAYSIDDEPDHQGASAGVCIREGYNHVLLNVSSNWYRRRTVTHEYAHVCLSDRWMPRWVEEGIVELVSMAVNDEVVQEVNLDDITRHRAYWAENTLDDFWAGETFYRADEGQHLSYQLAVWLVHGLLKTHRPLFLSALRKLDETDEPTAALCAELGVMPVDLLPPFLRTLAES